MHSLTPMPHYDSRAARVAWRLSRGATILLILGLAFLACLAFVALGFTIGRVSWWLITEHPLIVLPVAMLAVVMVGRWLK